MSCFFPTSLPFLLLLSTSLSLLSSSKTNAQQTHAMLPSETETIFKIMETMSSDQNWTLFQPNPCESPWPGLECKPASDNYLHVSRLDFGTKPNPSCQKTARFPNLIFSLPHLQSAFFFDCFTQTKTTLSFLPTRLSNSSLQQLSLRSNPSLIGQIPSQISSLKSLEILTLSQNRLSGFIPLSLYSLTSLIHLDLSYNMLTGTVPFQIGNLKNLVGLDLSYNSLSGSIPSAISQLGQLQKLDLSSNLLIGTIPQKIGNLHSLAFIALSNNKLRGRFPLGIGNLQNLQYFIMENNPIFAPLPLEFGMLVKLQELRLANSGYSGTIPPSFTKLTNLSTLSLQNNRLTGEIPADFRNLAHIYHLNLSRNFLSGVVPFDATFLKRLGKNLDLSGNPGLCLSPNEAYSVKVGVTVCKTSKNGTLIAPLKSSQAQGLSRSPSTWLSFSVSVMLGLYLLKFSSFF